MASRGVNKAISLYLLGLSIPEVSERTKLAKSKVRYWLKKAGALRSRSDGIRKAGARGRLGSGMRGKRREFSVAHKSNISKSKKGKGKGVSRKPSGYIEVTMGPNKGRGQHIVIMEQHLGRPIEAGEVVHHRNHDRSDNRIENLELMSRSEHSRHHALERVSGRERDSLGRFI